MAGGNLLVNDGKLSAVIDFGVSGVGDPACDLTIAWTLFSGRSREAFRAALPLDEGAWARGRGWALWKALITLAEHRHTDATKASAARRVLAEVVSGEWKVEVGWSALSVIRQPSHSPLQWTCYNGDHSVGYLERRRCVTPHA